MAGHGWVTPLPNGAKARCGGPGLCAPCSQEAATKAFEAAAGAPGEPEDRCPLCGQPVPDEPVRMTEATASATEAFINGTMSFSDVQEAVRQALCKRIMADTGKSYAWAYIADLTTTDVVYACGEDDLFQCSYTIDEAGEVTLGSPTMVVRAYQPAPPAMVAEEGDEPSAMEMGEDATEASDRIEGRVVEAKGTAADGGRIFRVRIIAHGDSKNGRRYPATTLAEAVPLYEGAKAYDHHRTEAELRSSTIEGLIGSYRSVEAEADGLYGDLHLLPSATHAAEALDATLAAQEEGLPPLIGVSHDVMARYRPVVEGGRRLQEATQITKVNSADLVADPAAGGKATRMVAGGIEPGTEPVEEGGDVPTKAEILAAFAEASDDELKAIGLARAAEAGTGQVRETEAAGMDKTAFVSGLMIREKIKAAGLPDKLVESVTAELPDRITEADVDAKIASLKSIAAAMEVGDLGPSAGRVEVTQESLDKKIEALDKMFTPGATGGYTSFKEAYMDITGRRPKGSVGLSEDFNRVVMRESIGDRSFDSSARAQESLTSSTWDVILGDSITRRMVAEYGRPNLQTWRQIVSSIVPVPDFRTQRIDRLGGYGTLPTVNQGQPYQPLTSPGDEEATYAITKKGGTEDLTLEMIANDDLRSIARIPSKLGLAAAQTLYRFVWDILPTNAAVTYDSTALFHTNHANTTAAALSQTALSGRRTAMRKQAAYGDTSDVLSIIPRFLIVPPDLEELAFQLCTSAVAIPSTPAGPTDTPNIHQGMQPIIVDYYSDTNDWYIACDPGLCPTIEVGFYQGRQDPELFTQSDPTQGSMFNSDTLTYKIRHIYSGAVLDHRGFQRGTA